MTPGAFSRRRLRTARYSAAGWDFWLFDDKTGVRMHYGPDPSATGSITLGYDTVGRQTRYTHRDGAGAVLTAGTTSYDLAVRAASRSDGKGTTTYTYDTVVAPTPNPAASRA